MNTNQLKDLHWLLMLSKDKCRYAEQMAEWNRIQAEFRELNASQPIPVIDLLYYPLPVSSALQD